MTRRRLIAAAIVLLVGGATVLWLRNDPLEREQRRIRKRLSQLASDASFSEQDSVISRLNYGSRVAPYFADPTELRIDRFDADAVISRAELEQGAVALRARWRGLQIQFLDIQVGLDSKDATNAAAHLTSRIYFAGDSDYWVQEFRLLLVKPAGEWLVRELSTVRTMEQ